jgi:acetylglutamate kinase
MRQEVVVLKLGGAALIESGTMEELVRTVRDYRKYDYDVVIVHGGGPVINAELTKRKITWEFIAGQRVTTAQMIEAIEEALFHQVNKQITEALNQAGVPAVSLSGALNEVLYCTPHQNTNLGFVGEVQNVNCELLFSHLKPEKNVVPVLAPIGYGSNGVKYNINADWAAAKVAGALKANKLIFLTDQFGILDTDKKPILEAGPEKLNQLLETGVVSGGMYTKVQTVLEALKNGVRQVRILKANQAYDGLWSEPIGTMCKA